MAAGGLSHVNLPTMANLDERAVCDICPQMLDDFDVEAIKVHERYFICFSRSHPYINILETHSPPLPIPFSLTIVACGSDDDVTADDESELDAVPVTQVLYPHHPSPGNRSPS